jgi:hypothetical protein
MDENLTYAWSVEFYDVVHWAAPQKKIFIRKKTDEMNFWGGWKHYKYKVQNNI